MIMDNIRYNGRIKIIRIIIKFVRSRANLLIWIIRIEWKCTKRRYWNIKRIIKFNIIRNIGR